MSIDDVYDNFVNEHAGYDREYAANKKQEVFNYVLDNCGLDKAAASNILNKVIELCCEYERQGFSYGFAEGLSLERNVEDLKKAAV